MSSVLDSADNVEVCTNSVERAGHIVDSPFLIVLPTNDRALCQYSLRLAPPD